MDEYLEKKKELHEAEEKAIEIKKTLRAQNREKFKEKFDKINFLHGLKPWTRTDILLAIFMIVLFLVAYNHGGAVDSEGDENFFSNVFGFLVKDSVDTEDNVESVENSEVVNSIEDTSDTGDTESIEDIEDVEDSTEEETVINFNLWTESEGNQFDIINTVDNSIDYKDIIQNLETFDIWCESVDSSVEVKAGEEREIYAMVSESDAGDDGKVINDHEFTCYDIDESLEEGYVKKSTVVVNFN